MLTAISIIKLIAEIAALALVGQWIVGLLSGAGRERNPFYQLLAAVGKPFVMAARYVTPRFVLDRHVPLVAFLLLGFLWLTATILKIQTCLKIGIELCK